MNSFIAVADEFSCFALALIHIIFDATFCCYCYEKGGGGYQPYFLLLIPCVGGESRVEKKREKNK